MLRQLKTLAINLLKFLGISGTNKRTAELNDLDKLEAVLDRHVSINSLDKLHSALSQRTFPDLSNKKIAFGIDTSVLLRLPGHRNRDDIIDYLDTKHQGPIIIPGQTIQEYWNNQHSIVDSVSQNIKKKYESLKQEASKVDVSLGSFATEMESLLSRFSTEYGHVYDPATLRSALPMLELLQRRASLSYIPRLRFQKIAESRKRTKTPPGFRDEGDGDFYVWIEFLYGLIKSNNSGQAFDHVVLLTHDQKIDWCKGGAAHPILAAEVDHLFQTPFEIWTLEDFSKVVNEQPKNNWGQTTKCHEVI